MRVEKEFIMREVGGEHIIVPVGESALEFNGLITVNEVGVFLWNLLQKDVTLDDLVKAVLNEYEVEEDVARKDVQEFLDILIKANILVADKD